MSRLHTPTSPSVKGLTSKPKWRLDSSPRTRWGEIIREDVQVQPAFQYGEHICNLNHAASECLCSGRPQEVKATSRAFNRLVAVTAKLAALDQPSAQNEERLNAQEAVNAAIARQLRPLSPSFANLPKRKQMAKKGGVRVEMEDSDDAARALERRRFRKTKITVYEVVSSSDTDE